MDCIVHGIAKSRTQLSNFQFHFLSFSEESLFLGTKYCTSRITGGTTDTQRAEAVSQQPRKLAEQHPAQPHGPARYLSRGLGVPCLPSCVWTLEVGKRIISFNTTLLHRRGVSTSVGPVTASQKDYVILGGWFCLVFMDLDIRKAEVKLSGDGEWGILQSHHLEDPRAFTSSKWSPQGPS